MGGPVFLREKSVIFPMFEFDKNHLIGVADKECSKHGKLGDSELVSNLSTSTLFCEEVVLKNIIDINRYSSL